MKLLICFCLLSVSMACGNMKKQEKPSTEPDKVSNMDEERMVGTVRKEKEGCVLIHVKTENRDILIYPNNLDERFQVNNMRIKFFFYNSSMPSPEDCFANARGNLGDVTPLR